jgi:hypothetical protein
LSKVLFLGENEKLENLPHKFPPGKGSYKEDCPVDGLEKEMKFSLFCHI